MIIPKLRGLLSVVLCFICLKTTYSQSANPGSFTFKLTSSARTSAGVYKTDSTLVRTLWADRNYAAGTYTEQWDGKDDFGNTISPPDATYIIKVLTNNVNYNWDGVIGNTSTATTGSKIHRGYYTSMTGMAITGTTAYFCQGYSEGYSSEAKFSITNPQVRLDLTGFGGRTSTMNSDYVTTDGKNVYWAGYNAYQLSISFVHATTVSNDAQVNFGNNGQSYTMTQLTNPKTYTSVLDLITNDANAHPTGLAVQQTGNYLFVSHGGINELHVFDKATGALVQNISLTNPQSLAVDGNNLWIASGVNTVAKYTVNANGTLSSAILTLSGISVPGAIQVNGSNIAVVDAGINQIVRFFNTSSGVEGTQLGTTGGYFTDATVTNTKFFFDDYRGNTNSFIAYAPDGSFWLGDPGNYRQLHFSASKTYMEYIMSLGATYEVYVDPNDATRVFAGGVAAGGIIEFAVDYSQPLTGNKGWALVKNWGVNVVNNINYHKSLRYPTTLSNGRTYAFIRKSNGITNTAVGSKAEFVELPSTGQLRFTGILRDNDFIMAPDGAIQGVNRANIGGTSSVYRYSLTGFNANNPTWSASQEILATNPITVKDPYFYILTNNIITSSNKILFWNPGIQSANSSILATGYHLGAMKRGGSKWLWETQKADDVNYKGAFPEADYFEIGNGVNQYAGGTASIIDNNIVTSYHGEFWKNFQTNYFNHYNDDGLAIGQFGTDQYISSDFADAGSAGNALTPMMVKNAKGNLFLYHGDESQHGAIHRWSITNLSSISEQYFSVPFPSSFVASQLGYIDLHAGLPASTKLPASVGWSTSGTVNSQTSLKKYVNDGSPDVFTTFAQSTGTGSVNRDLGNNKVTTNWKISGQLSFEGSDFGGSKVQSYIDVLDAAGKIIARFYYTTPGLALKGNSATIDANTSYLTLNQFQPFQVEVLNGNVTFTYANYTPVTTGIFDASANWKTPKTLRQYWTTDGTPAYGKNIGFMDMKFYKDYNAVANVPPVANAGLDTAIVLPVNIYTLKGSGSDADGTVTNFAWSKIAGPTSGTITNSNNSITTVTGLIKGVYVFELKVTDNLGASDVDTVKVTVDAAANIPPTADAGSNQTITLPVNNVTLTGGGTDSDGTVIGYSWKKIAGPASGAITNSNNSITTVTGLIQGLYKFELSVTDNSGANGVDTVQVTVDPAANLAPVANAGPDQKITLPDNIVSLAGSGGDADGTVVSYLWTKISGPSSYNIVNVSSPVTDISGLGQGVYLFQLEVADNDGSTSRDTILVTVNAAINIPPTVYAGQDTTITLPFSTASLAGSGNDVDGSIVNYLWTKISGPSSYSFVNSTLAISDVTNLTAGIYKFELKVTDNNGATARDTIQVTVNVAKNIPPVADAGTDQLLALPKNKIALNGKGTDPDGTIVNYLWTKIAGPSVVIAAATLPTTSVSTMAQGDYLFELKVTDNKGAVGKDTMAVTVIPAALPLKLLSFTGKLINEKAYLEWETTSEKNVSGFEIERLTATTWEMIGFVKSVSGNPLSNHYNTADLLPAIGFNYYRLKIVDIDGKFAYSDIISIEVNPVKNIIYQNVPNPFSNNTIIKFDIAESASIKIIVYNSIGIEVAVLLNEIKQPGSYQVQWNGKNVTPGSYFYKVIIGDDYFITKKMLKLH